MPGDRGGSIQPTIARRLWDGVATPSHKLSLGDSRLIQAARNQADPNMQSNPNLRRAVRRWIPADALRACGNDDT